LGDIRQINEYKIKKGICNLINNLSLLTNKIDNLSKSVDGFGSQNVKEWLIGDLSQKHWLVKHANFEDVDLYWNWANDKQVRKHAINKEHIEWEKHLKWFSDKLNDESCTMYIVYCDHKPIGQVRFDIEGNFAKIDYSIARQYRSRNIGGELLGKAIKEFQKFSNQRMYGEVLSGNIPSKNIFESLGFFQHINDITTIYTK